MSSAISDVNAFVLTPAHLDLTPIPPADRPADHVVESDQSDLAVLIDYLVRTGGDDAAPSASGLRDALGWTTGRLDAAVKVGEATGVVVRWDRGDEGVSIMLGEVERRSRKLHLETREVNGAFKFRWKPKKQEDRRLQVSKKVITESALTHEDANVNGNAGTLATISHREEDPGALLDAIEGYQRTLAGQKGGIRFEVFEAAVAAGMAPVGLVANVVPPGMDGQAWAKITHDEKAIAVDDPANHPGRRAFPEPGTCPECKGLAGEGSSVEYCVRCDVSRTIDRLIVDEVESADVYAGKRHRGPGKKTKNGPPELNKAEREIMDSLNDVRAETLKEQVDKRYVKNPSSWEDLWRLDPGSSAKR